jgi:predicted Zn-dependent protease
VTEAAARDLAELLRSALAEAGEPEAEAYARETKRGFARFAMGELGQHMQIEEPRVVVRVARHRRLAEASTSCLEPSSIVAAIRQAAAMAPEIPEDASFPGFAGADEPEPEPVRRYSPATAGCDAEHRVALLEPVLGRIANAGLIATGVLDTSQSIVAVATTHGLLRSHAGTLANFKVWALESAGAGGAAGHGCSAAIDLGELELESETERAVGDALRGKSPGVLEPGRYDVVLEPEAVAELVEWLGFIAFGARELAQGSSTLAGRIGERISGTALDITEDPLSDLSFADPFDREGVARRRVALVERGVARDVLCDRGWAARLRKTSTGSAAGPMAFGDGGPMASALVVAGGSAQSSAELVTGIARGIYVRRFHYVNGMLDPRRAVMTGLTRDGTFVIENGKLGRAVGNLRFTDSLLEAFERCDGLTARRWVRPNWWSDAGSVAAPAVRIRDLRFTGGSQVLPRLDDGDGAA